MHFLWVLAFISVAIVSPPTLGDSQQRPDRTSSKATDSYEINVLKGDARIHISSDGKVEYVIPLKLPKSMDSMSFALKGTGLGPSINPIGVGEINEDKGGLRLDGAVWLADDTGVLFALYQSDFLIEQPKIFKSDQR
jgi:hypothetical protein